MFFSRFRMFGRSGFRMINGFSALSLMMAAGCLSGCMLDAAEDDRSGETVGVASYAVRFTERYRWDQGMNPVTMTPYASSICFLVRVKGHFEGAGEAVQIYKSDGYWKLKGRSQQQGISASAACMTGITTERYTATKSWFQGASATELAPEAEHTCFLQGMTGRFEGNGEQVRTRVSNGKWYLDVTSLQADVGAWAACVKGFFNVTGNWEYLWTAPTPSKTLPATYFPNGNPCFLTRVQGAFTPDVEILIGWDGSYGYGQWLTDNSTNVGDLHARARCVL